MTEDRGVVRSIAWRDLFPWLVIFRTFGLAVGWPLLFLATAGVLLTPLGWHAAHFLFVSQDTLDRDPQFREIVHFNNRWPGSTAASNVPLGRLHLPDPAGRVLVTRPGDAVTVFQRLALPFERLFQWRSPPVAEGTPRWSVRESAYYLFGGLWTLLVWSFFGGAITRIAAMHLGREERVGLSEAVWFSLRKLGAYLAAPLLPLLAVFVLGAIIAVPSLGIWLGDFGVVIAGFLWPLAILAAFVMAILLLGLLFGWPLMWCTVSVEGTDPFDALARSYAYVFQRPLHYLFYGLLAALFGALGYAVVYYFSETLIELTFWAASWGAGARRMEQIAAILSGQNQEETSGPLWFGTGLLGLWVGLVRSVATAFSYSIFWCLATAIYLLLRHDVDQTEFDEVYLEDGDEPYGLPPLRPDKHGVPLVPDAPRPEQPPSEEPAREATPPLAGAPAAPEVSDGE